MTLTDVYKQSRQGGGEGRLASAVLDAQHWFCSLSDFDPRSGEPLPRALTRVLSEISAGAAIRNGPPRDRLWRICRHCGMSLQTLYRAPNEEPFRVHELLHVRDVRELDVQSFVKLSMRPGLNVRQKLAGNPHLDAVRHTMTLDLPENRLLKACSEELEHRLDAKETSVGLTTEEADLLDKIKSWLHSDAADSISRWTVLPPNNTLLSHRDYRRVWDAWRQLGRLDEETADDVTAMSKIAEGIRFWNGMAKMRRVNGVGMAEVPLMFDLAMLSIVPFGNARSRGIPVVVMESEDHDTVQGRIVPYGTTLPKMTEEENAEASGTFAKAAGTVCVDPSSALPTYSIDGSSAKTLRHFLAWQRWSDVKKSQSADVGCFGADGVWTKDGIETVLPLDVFFQDRHERSVLDIAFRTMVDFLKASYFSGESFIWLAPDFLDEFTLGIPRRAFNASFAAAEPLPRSIAAVVAQIPYDSVNPEDSILVIDQLGGVVCATKVVASYDEELAVAVPETHGIRWTRHPSVVLRDERATRGVDSELPVVNGSGEWTFGRTSNSINPIDYLDKAEELLGHCIEPILATNPHAPLTCGGFRVHVLQQKAGDLAIWRDQLPALSMGGVIVDGMYGDFTLVDASSQSIRPVRGQAVSIPVPQLFNLPKLKAVFPLHQGEEREGRQTLDFVAEVDFPPQESSTPCRLDLRYTYGADEPYSLDFIPIEAGQGLPRRIPAKWKRADQTSAFVPSSYSSPFFPEMKSWQELSSFLKKDGSGVSDLVNWAEQKLEAIDPEKAAYDDAARKEEFRKKQFLKREAHYRNNRKTGIIKSPVIQKGGAPFFFIDSDDGETFYCRKSGLRHSSDIEIIDRGTPVWFSVWNFTDKKTGEEKTWAVDVALDDALPDALIQESISLSQPIRPKVLPLGNFISANEERLRISLFNARFPILTIMQGARNLSDLTVPDRLRHAVQKASDILDQCLACPEVSDSFKSEALQVLSYLHSFAPPVFQHWALDVARSGCFLGEEDRWRKLAFCLGDMSQSWQREICNALTKRLSRPKDRLLVLGLLGVASWRSSRFLDKIPLKSVQRILSALQLELELGLESKKRWYLYALSLELLLALLRVNQATSKRYAPELRPGTPQAAIFVDLLDQWTNLLHSREKPLRFRVNMNTSKKPKALYNTPDFLYALRCYLTGDDGANAISITSIDEGSDSDDA